jgi:hypothetical protein
MNDKKLICPYFQRECIKDGVPVQIDGRLEIHACPAWVFVQGKNPQTGADINEWNCSQFHWIPFLMIENSKLQHETGAAVESFRNEMVKANQSAQQLLQATAGNLIGGAEREIKNITQDV